jgi:acetylornithine deacetylase/succinyl-diaminopimelate desuccinylase-like protein
MAQGKSAHAASHYLGDNTVYKMANIIANIRELDRRFRLGMGYDELLGHPSIAITDAHVQTASLNAVPNQFRFPVDKHYPAWALDEAHPLVGAGQQAIETLWGERRSLGTWDFPINGTYWAGEAKIPSIGFGPGDEKTAHMLDENLLLKNVVRATEFYALLPGLLTQA